MKPPNLGTTCALAAFEVCELMCLHDYIRLRLPHMLLLLLRESNYNSNLRLRSYSRLSSPHDSVSIGYSTITVLVPPGTNSALQAAAGLDAHYWIHSYSTFFFPLPSLPFPSQPSSTS